MGEGPSSSVGTLLGDSGSGAGSTSSASEKRRRRKPKIETLQETEEGKAEIFHKTTIF